MDSSRFWIVGGLLAIYLSSLSAQEYHCPAPVGMPPGGEGWVALFDGDASDLNDWSEALDEPAGAWKVIDGVLTHEDTIGGNHLFYAGPEGPWGELELVCEFRTEVGSNSGVYFRSIYTAEGFPQHPYDLEAQINNTANATLNRRTGNLIPRGDSDCGASSCVSNYFDNVWTQMRVVCTDVDGGASIRVIIEVNGEQTTDKTFSNRDLGGNPIYPNSGTICLQGEGLGPGYDRIEFRNVYVRHLPVTSCDGWDVGSPSIKEPLPLGYQAADESIGTTQQTIALYHFDQDLANSVARNARLTSKGNATLSSDDLGWMAQPTGAALKVSGEGDEVAGAILEDLIYPSSSSEISVEMLLKVNFIKNQGDPNINLLTIHTGDTRFWEFRVTKWDTSPSLSYNNVTLVDPSAFQPHWQYGSWMHLRITYDSNGLASVFINNQLIGQANVDVPQEDYDHWTFRLGNFQGFVDEFRISASAYTGGATAPLTLSDWRSQMFASSDLSDANKEATIWGDTADADDDGFTTLAEYCLGLNPLKADGFCSFEGTVDTNPMTVRYVLAKQSTGMNLRILGGDNLSPTGWLPESVTSSTPTSGLLYDHVELELGRDISADTRRFISLGVTPLPVP